MATRCRIIWCALLAGVSSIASGRQQEETLPIAMENNLENEAAGTSAVSEDDAQWQQWNMFVRHKIQLNTADEATLQSLGLLTALQISSFLRYRALLGKLVSIYELQAVPGFDLDVIRRILPYVYVGNDLVPHYTWHDYLHKGDQIWLLRYGRQLEPSKGYLHTDSTLPAYRGSPDKLFIRYRYSFPHYISGGVVMEKDAGEALFKGAQQQGFDFYSAHIFLSNYRNIKALALGDYTVNLGQGLLNWQSQAYGKGAAVMQVKREGAILRPYTSSGEFYFFRGAATTLQWRCWEITAFASWRRQDAATDTLTDEITAASVVSSGYHRTAAEIKKRGQVSQTTAGGNIRYVSSRWQWGVNMIYHGLAPALRKKTAPYNQFDFNGRQLSGISIDYAGSWKNVHLFGEVARSSNGKPALLQGLLTSIAPAVDIALVYRYYDRAYQSLYAKGFGNNYRTVNEQGMYTALTAKVNRHLKLDAYADFFKFPWLKYRSSAPSGGNDFFLLGTYTAGKKITWLLRYNYRQSNGNVLLPGNPMKVLAVITASNIRFQWNMQANKQLSGKMRGEYIRYRSDTVMQQGWMIFQDCSYHFRRIPFTISGRVACFHTGGYDTRIYATESSVLYENAVSQLYGKGWQYYLNIKWKVNRRLACWTRFHQSLYTGVTGIGSGNDLIQGTKKTLLQCQIQYTMSGEK
ncbi:ComEA family DNA-binding protein [Chitinophaga sp. 30R24]|uniref:ComEA family DNA-binding protein n=1 Tax=Chitinophaga sp. 30R24 TaxID=3248838 RepID=UPI003B8F806B